LVGFVVDDDHWASLQRFRLSRFEPFLEPSKPGCVLLHDAQDMVLPDPGQVGGRVRGRREIPILLSKRYPPRLIRFNEIHIKAFLRLFTKAVVDARQDDEEAVVAIGGLRNDRGEIRRLAALYVPDYEPSSCELLRHGVTHTTENL
jgi:hypothetical protein